MHRYTTLARKREGTTCESRDATTTIAGCPRGYYYQSSLFGFLLRLSDWVERALTAGTEKQYKGVWDKWSGWCHKRQIDLPQASALQAVEFLTDCIMEAKDTVPLTLTVLHYLQHFPP